MNRFALVLCLAACEGMVGGVDSGTSPDVDSGVPVEDAGRGDAGAVDDAGVTDSGVVVEPDAGTVVADAGPVDAGNGLVPVFMAQGHLGRTIMSCDDGQTWVNDRSDNPTGQCWVPGPNEVECDHTPISGTGLDQGDGYFFANFGWGYNGSARRTRDGVTWQTINTGAWGGGISYSEGVVVWLAGGNWPVSLDRGETWSGSAAAIPNGYFDSRTLSRFGKKIAVSGDPVAGLFSRDSGRTWFLVTLNDTVWSRNVKIAEGNGKLISLSSRVENNVLIKYQSSSPDDGLTWNGTRIDTGGNDGNKDWQGLWFTGSEFVTFADGKKLTSTDGATWSETAVSPAAAARGPIARGPGGTYVSIPNNWGGYYAAQRAYRSTDGVTWTQLSTTAFPGGHPITKLVSGWLPAAACP